MTWAQWLEEQTGNKMTSKEVVYMGARDSRENITAALAFHNYTGHDLEISGAGTFFPRWLLRRAYFYCVRQLGVSRITFRTPVENKRARRINARLGAKFEAVLKDYYGEGKDAIQYCLLKKDFKF